MTSTRRPTRSCWPPGEAWPGPRTAQQVELDALGSDGRRELVDAFVAAWERADVAALLGAAGRRRQVHHAAAAAWFLGRDVIGRWCELMFATPWRLLPIRANGQLAFALLPGRPGRWPVPAGRDQRC